MLKAFAKSSIFWGCLESTSFATVLPPLSSIAGIFDDFLLGIRSSGAKIDHLQWHCKNIQYPTQPTGPSGHKISCTCVDTAACFWSFFLPRVLQMQMQTVDS